jgi:hypothetical protein
MLCVCDASFSVSRHQRPPVSRQLLNYAARSHIARSGRSHVNRAQANFMLSGISSIIIKRSCCRNSLVLCKEALREHELFCTIAMEMTHICTKHVGILSSIAAGRTGPKDSTEPFNYIKVLNPNYERKHS